jgi:hypothetical protein
LRGLRARGWNAGHRIHHRNTVFASSVSDAKSGALRSKLLRHWQAHHGPINVWHSRRKARCWPAAAATEQCCCGVLMQTITGKHRSRRARGHSFELFIDGCAAGRRLRSWLHTAVGHNFRATRMGH